VAGYHPANLPVTPPGGVTYDYWMFEGIRPEDNRILHVTSTGCDDLVAVSLCAGALGALSLHGFDPAPELPPDEQIVLAGGANPTLKDLLMTRLDDAHIKVQAVGRGAELDGDSPCNIVNRTLPVGDPPAPLGGVQLELSTPLRDAMFTENSRPRRRHTTTEVFWTFVAACRDALDRFEAEPAIASPDVRCRDS
jgi:phage replication-related protein YjqB (UPF0714/DUF867 family)